MSKPHAIHCNLTTMLFEKPRHPDQNLYIHPGSRGMSNPSILVPNFIERRYDDMIEARSRDGASETISDTKQNIEVENTRNDSYEYRRNASTNYSLPPILENDNIVKPQKQRILPSDAENNNHIENTKTEGSLSTKSITEQNQLNSNSSKHPLKHSWTFWYFNINGGAATWDENLIKICDVTTIEDFWAVFHHMQDVAALESGCDYALFKVILKDIVIFYL